MIRNRGNPPATGAAGNEPATTLAVKPRPYTESCGPDVGTGFTPVRAGRHTKKIVRKFDRSNVRGFPESVGTGFRPVRADRRTQFSCVVVSGAIMSTARFSSGEVSCVPHGDAGERTWRGLAAAIAACALVMAVPGPRAAGAAGGASADAARAAIAKGAAYLLAQQQPDGSWERHAGLTAVTILALLPRAPEVPPAAGDAVARGLAYLDRMAQPDGGIYHDDLRHYTTSVAMLAFAASGDPAYKSRIAAAREFLLTLQAREENGFPPADPRFGGTLIGEGKANLDATFFSMRALAEAGLPRDHPYWGRALRFVTRCQNAAPANDQPWANADGGFVFSPGFSFAGGTASYGSMTYAGLSAYLDAGVPRGDDRVEAAFRWLRANFTARENPRLAKQALFHSYFYMAHTLRRWGVEGWTNGAGPARAWGRELTEALAPRQRADGSWANTEDPRWWESRPVLATAFAVRALREAIR